MFHATEFYITTDSASYLFSPENDTFKLFERITTTSTSHQRYVGAFAQVTHVTTKNVGNPIDTVLLRAGKCHFLQVIFVWQSDCQLHTKATVCCAHYIYIYIYTYLRQFFVVGEHTRVYAAGCVGTGRLMIPCADCSYVHLNSKKLHSLPNLKRARAENMLILCDNLVS